jgi:hypothetical protein
MTDILIRDVAEATVARIDRLATESGISRNELLRRWIDRDFRRTGEPTTRADLARFSELARDLTDPEVMHQAWA